MENMNEDYLSLLVVSTTLCAKYDQWKEQANILDMHTNETCKFFKTKYPDADDKVIKSITMGFLLYMYSTIVKISKQYQNIDI